ncbi:hypothetical protein [Arthrobacter sp. UYCo732]|uniref:hypothetical protein n=1 Tax=Arthrobacter sp. UYCo732 TaxID=3156336 RepID=UPI0033946BD1
MSTAQPVKHLWEVEHPYRCEFGNFYERGLHSHYDSWAEFSRPVEYDRSGPQLRQTGTLLYSGDPDLNCLYRWDWQALHLTDPGLFPETYHRLSLFFIMQGKAYNQSVEIAVAEADEPAIRAWIAERAATMRSIWDPFLQ